MAPHQGHHSLPSPKIPPFSEIATWSGRNSLPQCLALITPLIHLAGLEEKFMVLLLPEIGYLVPAGFLGKAPPARSSLQLALGSLQAGPGREQWASLLTSKTPSHTSAPAAFQPKSLTMCCRPLARDTEPAHSLPRNIEKSSFKIKCPHKVETSRCQEL